MAKAVKWNVSEEAKVNGRRLYIDNLEKYWRWEVWNEFCDAGGKSPTRQGARAAAIRAARSLPRPRRVR